MSKRPEKSQHPPMLSEPGIHPGRWSNLAIWIEEAKLAGEHGFHWWIQWAEKTAALRRDVPDSERRKQAVTYLKHVYHEASKRR